MKERERAYANESHVRVWVSVMRAMHKGYDKLMCSRILEKFIRIHLLSHVDEWLCAIYSKYTYIIHPPHTLDEKQEREKTTDSRKLFCEKKRVNRTVFYVWPCSSCVDERWLLYYGAMEEQRKSTVALQPRNHALSIHFQACVKLASTNSLFIFWIMTQIS